jgi:SNF2 family DNA or RNA helicase
MDFCFKTEPRPYQLDTFVQTRDEEYWALLLDMGLGKTKIALDTAAWLYSRSKINGLLIIAPPGVQNNWLTDEIPVHLPDYIDYVAACWRPDPLKSERLAMDKVFSTNGPVLHILAMNYEALATAKGVAIAKRFLLCFKTLLVCDESTAIQNKTIRTTNIINLGAHAPYRRILNGSPMTESPLNCYYQYAFLDPYALKSSSFYAFRTRYALLQKIDLPGRHSFVKVTGYQRLDELQKLIYSCSTRITTEDAGLNLPPQTYVKRYVTMTANQARVYAELKKNLCAEIAGYGTVTAPLAITLLLRLQQVVGGYVNTSPAPLSEGEDGLRRTAKTVVPLDTVNPRIEALLDITEEAGTRKIIIYAKFRAEIAGIVAALSDKYGADAVVQYHGGITADGRDDAKFRFQGKRPIIDPRTKQPIGMEDIPPEKQARFFVANKAAARGLTLTAATITVYYSNEFSLDIRTQNEKRMHRIGQDQPCLYIDLQTSGTVDEKIVDALRRKMDIMRLVTGDNYKEWI